MKQPKPILTIKQKCRKCKPPIPQVTNEFGKLMCKSCKGTGQQETEIYPLRDFERCYTTMTHDELCLCKGTGHKIPFKDYEIKTVKDVRVIKEVVTIRKDDLINFKLNNNLKETDKLVIKKKSIKQISF